MNAFKETSLRKQRRKGRKKKRAKRKDMKKTNGHSNDLSLGGAPSQVRLVLMVLMATPSQVWGACITLFLADSMRVNGYGTGVEGLKAKTLLLDEQELKHGWCCRLYRPMLLLLFIFLTGCLSGIQNLVHIRQCCVTELCPQPASFLSADAGQE